MAHRGLEPAESFDSKSNALSTALPRKICELGFKHCTVYRYSIATMLHVTAEPRGRQVKTSKNDTPPILSKQGVTMHFL